ncbi:solute carrier family 35 member E2 [Caerostris extrusa]|uniref:Solute carrier family 35 member E2 n=1 Tax=Caerostris extrusa TaxID=172846 RepID=A0AAV4VD86_CAEEX|nr:solute carrier family 35 member E2 [Caerostris extrusa]
MNSESIPNLHREQYELSHSELSECIMEDDKSNLVNGFDDKDIHFHYSFLNKYILAYEQGDPALLGSAQLLMCVGSLRFATLILGLIALWFVPVSFAETVKSSAPVFTVFLAWLLMGEKNKLACLYISSSNNGRLSSMQC